MTAAVLGVILHVQAGNGSPYGWFSNPGNSASSTFWIAKTGTLEQYVDTDLQAWAQAAGNPAYWSVETEGQPGEPLTDAQIATFGRLYAWLCSLPAARFGVTLAEAPGEPGLGWHGMGGAAWGGHTGCPGELRKSQRPAILAAASTPEDDMPLTDDDIAKVAEAVWGRKVNNFPDPAHPQAAADMLSYAHLEAYNAARRAIAGVDPATIAAAIPADIAQQVADELAKRLGAGT